MIMRFIYSVLVLFFSSQFVCAKEIKRPDTYNYTRGVEALQNKNVEEAIDFFTKELQENPKNGYAHYWISCINDRNGEYGKALTSVNLALKYIPGKDKEYVSYVLASRANIYIGLNEKDKALNDLSQAIEKNPGEEDLYEKRGQLYFELENFEEGDKDYKMITKLDEGSVMGYMGLGRNANAQGKYKDAIDYFNYVIKLAENYSSGYSFRAESYLRMGNLNKSAEDIMRALSIDYDNKAYYLLHELADSSLVLATSKLKIEATKQPNNGYWPFSLGDIYERAQQPLQAIAYFKDAYKVDDSPIIAYRLSTCYESIGDFEKSLDLIDCAIDRDSTDYDYVLQKADIYYEIGESEKAISELDKYIRRYPEFYGGYYRRGFFKDNTNDVDGAIDDYTMSITQNPNYAYAYLGRADMYSLKGNNDLAKDDYKKVIELDTVPINNSCAHYAFLQLGFKDKAIDFLNRVIKQDQENAGNYYDAACLYARMKDSTKSLMYLEQAFKKGYTRFNHLKNDDDLNLIKGTEQFKSMVNQYKAAYQEKMANPSDNDYEEKIAEVPFVNENGILKVQCKINNLPLYFIFDTGASDVSMSNVEAAFMLKNDYLLTSDIQGSQNYLTADGSISEGTIINLRNVDFAGLSLNNINASIVRNQKAPLLLGQSVLKRLGRFEIDNEHRIIRITYRVKKEK